MHIRLMKRKDINEVVTLFTKTFAKEKKQKRWDKTIAEKYILMIYRLSKEMCFVATEGERIIGASLNIVIPECNKEYLKIYMLVVDKEYRKKNIASKLLKKVLYKAYNKYSITTVELELENIINFPILWFEKIGFNKKQNYELMQANVINVYTIL